jgi:hypothetical protein
LSHLSLGLPCGVFPSGFAIKILYAFFTSPMLNYMPRPNYCPWLDHPNHIWWSVQVTKLLIMQSSLVSRHFIPYRYKCTPQHPCPKHPISVFLL